VLLYWTDDAGLAGSVLAQLYGVLKIAYHREGTIDILDESIEAARQGIELIPHEHSEWRSLAHSLGVSLQYRFTLTQHAEDLDESISVLTKVLALTAEDDVHFADYADILAAGFSYRSQARNNRRDIDRSIGIWKKSLG
jgi:hypothetical protein